MKRKLGTLVITFLIFSLPLSCGRTIRKKSLPGPDDKVYTVSQAQVATRDIPDLIQKSGDFIPLQRLEVKSDFTGKVQALSVAEGQTVFSGEVLLKIEDELLPFVQDRQRAELREAEAQSELDLQLETATAPGDAFEEGYEEGDLEEPEFAEESPEESPPPEEGFEEAEEELEGQDASLARLARLRRRAQLARRNFARRPLANRPPPTAQEPEQVVESRRNLNEAKIERIRTELAITEKQLEGSTLTTALDGFINKTYVSEGSLVKPGDLLLEIIAINPIDLSVKVPKNEIGKINKQMEVQVTVPDLAGRSYKGEISFIGAELDPTQKFIEVRVRVDNADEKIKVGMEGVAQMGVSNKSHQALLVPANAVLKQDGKAFVYVIDGQVAVKREVVTGSFFENMIEIKRGVRKSDYVVTRGVDQLTGEEEFIKIGAS